VAPSLIFGLPDGRVMRRRIHAHGSCRSILFHLDENEKMMLDQINRDEGVNLLQQIGLGTH